MKQNDQHVLFLSGLLVCDFIIINFYSVFSDALRHRDTDEHIF